MHNNFNEDLKNLLMETLPYANLGSGGKELYTRCMYCGDSTKHANSTHLGINLGYNNTPLYFHCFKCHVKGLITHKVLMDWGIFDQSLYININNYNKNVLSLPQNKKFNDRVVYKLNNNYISNNKLSEVKLKYINNRLKLNLTYDDLLQNKIVLNIYDLLNANHITNLTRHENLVSQMNESFLGFISQDNAFINLRNLRPGKVDKSLDKRYINYNIFGKFNNTERFYTIPTQIDLTYPKPIKLNIAEGPFDILSIYHNIINKEKHTINSAILGSGYINILKHFIINMKLINLEVHVYIDNDVSYYIINQIRELLRVYNMPFYLHRNMMNGEKDFGVSMDRIKEQIERIL